MSDNVWPVATGDGRSSPPPGTAAGKARRQRRPTGAPPPDTLAWYRLACFLPRVLPAGVNISEGESARAAAGADYRYLMEQLGPCPRNRK